MPTRPPYSPVYMPVRTASRIQVEGLELPGENGLLGRPDLTRFRPCRTGPPAEAAAEWPVYNSPVAKGYTQLRQNRANMLAFPGFLMVVLLAVCISNLFAHPPNPIVWGVCGVLAVLDVFLGWWVLRAGSVTFAVTPQSITFTPAQGKSSRKLPPQVIGRSDGGTLSFRMVSGGNIADDQAALRLRDDASGIEVPVLPFSRLQVKRACESQGWRFS